MAAKIVDGLLGTGRKEFESFMTPILGAKLQILQETSADQKSWKE